MKYFSIKTLSDIRKEIWDIQDKVQKERDTEDYTFKIHRYLGVLSNKIMEYIFNDLENSDSQDELLNKLETLTKEPQEPSPYFIDLKNNIEAIKKRILKHL